MRPKKGKTMDESTSAVNTVQCDDNGGCGECACPCHGPEANPGPHIATCKFADDDYVPPDFVRKVHAAINRARS